MLSYPHCVDNFLTSLVVKKSNLTIKLLLSFCY
nr:MAG TPA: hypothetical protein [Caudoviricetes sp.]